MYIEKLALTNIRTFDKSGEIEFVHPGRDSSSPRENGAGTPRLPNVNLLLGDNGSGKTTLLQAVALAAFGPAVADANLGARHLVRSPSTREHGAAGKIRAVFRLHRQDSATGYRADSILQIQRRGELPTGRPAGWSPERASTWVRGRSHVFCAHNVCRVSSMTPTR